MQAQRIRAQHNERIVLAHSILGRTIEELRTARGITRRELAAATHSNARYIGALEGGRINPPFHVLLRLIHPLGVTMGDLFARYQAHHEVYPARPA